MQQIIALLRNRTYLISFRGSFKTHKPMLQCLGNSYVQRTHGKLKQTAKNFLHVRHNILSQPKQDNFLLFSNRFFFRFGQKPALLRRLTELLFVRGYFCTLCAPKALRVDIPHVRGLFSRIFFSRSAGTMSMYTPRGSCMFVYEQTSPCSGVI